MLWSHGTFALGTPFQNHVTFTTHSPKNTWKIHLVLGFGTNSAQVHRKVCDPSEHSWDQVTVFHCTLWLGEEKNLIKKLWLRCTWEFEFSLGINLVQNSEAGNCLERRVAGVYALTCTAKRISSTGATRTRQQTWPLPTLTEPRECQYCRHSNRDSLLKQIPHQSHYPCSGLQLGAALELANWVPSGWNCTGDHAWGEYLAHLLHIHGTRQELVQPHPPPEVLLHGCQVSSTNCSPSRPAPPGPLCLLTQPPKPGAQPPQNRSAEVLAVPDCLACLFMSTLCWILQFFLPSRPVMLAGYLC